LDLQGDSDVHESRFTTGYDGTLDKLVGGVRGDKGLEALFLEESDCIVVGVGNNGGEVFDRCVKLKTFDYAASKAELLAAPGHAQKREFNKGFITVVFESTATHYLLTRYNNARVVPITKDAPGFGPHAGEYLAVDALHGCKRWV